MGIVYSDISVSADGFATGLNQREEAPFGDIDESWLHSWMFDAYAENSAEVDAIVDSGATIMGRNMFGPVRGEWDRDWRGWWGPNPPFHTPVFVLTHHPRPSIDMEGGTVFHFVDADPQEALDLAREAAGDLDVRIGGGAETIRQYLEAGAIDELHIAVSPVLLGAGEPLWRGLDLPALGYALAETTAGERATHLRIVRKDRQ